MRQLFREIYSDLTPFGRFWFNLGTVALVASCAMSFFFGKSISLTHGVFLVVLSAVAAWGPHAAHKVFAMSRPAGYTLAICCIPLLAIEFYSHAGYTAGLRGTNIGDAKVQQAKYTVSYDAVHEDKEALEKAVKERDELKSANPWAEKTTAGALRAELPAVEEAIAQEARRGGCGPKCLALKEKKAGIESRIAVIEDGNKIAIRIENLEKRISAHREKATATEFKHSAAAHQQEFLGKLVALVSAGSLDPTELQSASAEQSVNLAMAIAATGLPAFCYFIMGFFSGRREQEPQGRPEAQPAPTQTAEQVLEAFLDNVNRHVPKGVPQFAV
jgi:hypothetical protein